MVFDTNDERRLMELDWELSPRNPNFHKDCDIWEIYHRERLEICERLGLDPTKPRPWDKQER